MSQAYKAKRVNDFAAFDGMNLLCRFALFSVRLAVNLGNITLRIKPISIHKPR